MKRYFWEEDIDGNLYVYLNKMDRDNIIFGRTPPLCSVSSSHIPAKQRQIADFIVNALNEHENH